VNTIPVIQRFVSRVYDGARDEPIAAGTDTKEPSMQKIITRRVSMSFLIALVIKEDRME
jgi:hypothetical protein